jgi:hypothetical protein
MEPRETVSIRLWAQVEAAMPRMEIDSENCLRMVAGKSKKGSIILGDVAQSFIRALGPSDPPVILSELRFDEQRWEILASAFGVDVSIKSEPYWGFGIFTKCFLNEICISGSRPSVDRIVFDAMASLGGIHGSRFGEVDLRRRAVWTWTVTKTYGEIARYGLKG